MEAKKLDIKKTKEFIDKYWDESLQPAIEEFVRIPNLSRDYDENWQTNGRLEQAAQHVIDWALKQNIKGMKVKLLKDEGKTPMVYMDIEGTNGGKHPILMYAHLDKQPYFDGWREEEGIHPTKPIRKGDFLFGRGANDDGYGSFAALTAIKILQDQNLPYPRTILLLETDEESGSNDYKYYLDKVKGDFPDIAVVYCLDSGCLTYDSLWITGSLRGCLIVKFTVSVLKEGVHSGDASGVVPSSFRIIRMLLDRIEDSKTGTVHEDLHVVIPPNRYQEAVKACQKIPDYVHEHFKLLQNMTPVSKELVHNYLNRTWKPQVSYVGMDGIPSCQNGGNVLRPFTTMKISIRLPPTLDVEVAKKTITKLLTTDVPYGAKVTIDHIVGMPGWNAPTNQPYFDESVQSAAKNFFGEDAQTLAEGGSIPLMKMLNDLFPSAQFMVIGVEGPASNAHGPNECLHIPMTKKLIGTITQVITETATKLN